MLRYLLYLASALLGMVSAGAQSYIYGEIRDADSGAPAEFVQVILYRYGSNDVVAFKYTDDKGRYELVIRTPAEKTFTLKTSGIGYENVERDVFLDTRTDGQRFEINLLLRRKTHQLGEVQVTAKRPPLIVKQDTIIYDVDHWTDEFDQSLESVLAKIPGFEILPGGEIKVNGKLVNKVLINGEEMSNAGAALITRNLSPDRVKSVEVRFDEKEEKLKESLLSTRQFVVLDIKLKDDFNQSLFGRVDASIGYRAHIHGGGIARLFSLNSKAKLQILSEWDEFGDKTIELSQIKNLGAEAFAQIFEVPADFSRLRQNPEYSNEIYGFREYVDSRTGSAGVTGKISISPTVDIFMGTFNYLDRVDTRQNLNQILFADTPREFSFQNMQSFRSANSKNKLELVANPENMKIKYNFNAVFSTNKTGQVQDIPAALFYDFFTRAVSKSFYHNLFVERRFADYNGLQFSLMYSADNVNVDHTFLHDNPLYASFYYPAHTGVLPQSLRQHIPTQQKRLLAKLFYQAHWKGQRFQPGMRLLRDELTGEKHFFFKEEPVYPESPLAANSTTLRFIQILPYIEHSFDLGGFNLSNKAGLAYHAYPNGNGAGRKTKSILEWNSSITWNWTEETDIALSFAQNASAFPLYQLLPGLDMSNFQMLAGPGHLGLSPQRERVMSLTATTYALAHHGLALEFAALNGRANNSPSFSFNEAGLIVQYFDQLPSKYYLLVGKIAKTFERFPFQMKLEPSFIINTSFNRTAGLTDDELTSVTTRISALDYRAFTHFKDKSYNLETRLKWTNFTFSNELDNQARTQHMWNVFLKYKQTLLQRKLQLHTGWRYTSFSGNNNASLLLMDTGMDYIHKKKRFSLQIHNLFNSRAFIAQEITPAFFSDTRRFIFGRYAKLGFSIDIN